MRYYRFKRNTTGRPASFRWPYLLSCWTPGDRQIKVERKTRQPYSHMRLQLCPAGHQTAVSFHESAELARRGRLERNCAWWGVYPLHDGKLQEAVERWLGRTGPREHDELVGLYRDVRDADLIRVQLFVNMKLQPTRPIATGKGPMA